MIIVVWSAGRVNVYIAERVVGIETTQSEFELGLSFEKVFFAVHYMSQLLAKLARY